MIAIVKWVLNWLLSHGDIKLYSSPVPVGRRLGGHDVAGVIDKFLIISLLVDDKVIFSGYFQTA